MDKFEQVYMTNKLFLYQFIMKMCKDENLSEELTQETLFKAFLNMDYFQGKCKISSWLCQIAKNEYLNYIKKHNKIVKIELSVLDKVPTDEDNSAFRKIEIAEQSSLILKEAYRLESPYQDVFLEKVLAELSYAEIAELHSKSESWVRVTFFRAKKKLLERIEHNE